MITIPDAMRRPAEVERDELKKQLAEAQAEIERLNKNLSLLCWGFDGDCGSENIVSEIANICAAALAVTQSNTPKE